jgi:RluA family pseudouridine synthase
MHTPTEKITNIAAYQFATLTDLRTRRADLLAKCRDWNLKGTILLSHEGINLFLAGSAESIDRVLAELRSWPGLETLTPKYSETDHVPFHRMLVRLKKEIIAFGIDGIEPARRASPKLPARTLKQWLDEGRPLTLLDTRNDYEVRMGTFENALPIGIDHFRDFPSAVNKLPADVKNRPVVMFCTGGIRCEKAGPFMEQAGFENVFQLDGGILKYFEECGGAHYRGECFVFDQRVGVGPNLRETGSGVCFKCQSPLTVAEQADPRHVPGVSCPYCFLTPEEQHQRSIQKRHQKLETLIDPLPGSVPADHFKPVRISEKYAGLPLAEALGAMIPALSVADWSREIEAGSVLHDNDQPASTADTAKAGVRYRHRIVDVVEPPVNPRFEILHEDEALIVLNKPAPLPMHPGGRFYRNTLQHFIDVLYHPQRPHPAHRLDANTTGVVLFTRTRHFAGRLQPQFERNEVVKTYLARVRGTPTEDHFICECPIAQAPRELGARAVDHEQGLPARTEFRVIRRDTELDGTTLLEVKPFTGRTNQIRIHLEQLGFPLVGDQTYSGLGTRGDRQTLSMEDQPLCLHALRIEFRHPLTLKPVTFEAPRPPWAQ